jgi:hypothetical protein
MRWLNRLLAGVLALALTATALVWVTSHTLWSATYLEHSATSTHLSSELATALPEIATQYVPAGPARTALASIITPGYVAGELTHLIPDFIAANRTNAPAPMLNLTSLNEQLVALGVPVPTTLMTVLSTPQPLIPDNIAHPIKTAGQLTGQLAWLAPLVALGALILILFVAGRRRLLAISGALISAAGLTALAALALQLPPYVMNAALTSSAARPVAPALNHFASAIAKDQLHQLLVLALALLIAAVGLAVLHYVLALVTHMTRRHAEAAPADREE